MEELISRMSRIELSSSCSTSTDSVADIPVPARAEVTTQSILGASTTEAERSSSPGPRDHGATTNEEFARSLSLAHSVELRSLLDRIQSCFNKLMNGAQPTSASPPPLTSGNRTLTCKKDMLGDFDGNPLKLLENDISRFNTDPLWELVVICTLSESMRDDAVGRSVAYRLVGRGCR
ncbi:hypothetical protein CF327_g7732 [Tilletia walkeri]|nr:hypothetical protein CF327_g7732 [Tilletia walkeri]